MGTEKTEARTQGEELSERTPGKTRQHFARTVTLALKSDAKALEAFRALNAEFLRGREAESELSRLRAQVEELTKERDAFKTALGEVRDSINGTPVGDLVNMRAALSPKPAETPRETCGAEGKGPSGQSMACQLPKGHRSADLGFHWADGTPFGAGVRYDGERVYWTAPAESARPGPRTGAVDLVAHLTRQRAWSERTFGPGPRTSGLIDHIRKELKEIEAAPSDLSEWIDVAILAFDGAWRAGHTPEAIATALVAKQAKNEGRTWPDWRTAEPGKAIEHVRAPAQPKPEERRADKFVKANANGEVCGRCGFVLHLNGVCPNPKAPERRTLGQAARAVEASTRGFIPSPPTSAPPSPEPEWITDVVPGLDPADDPTQPSPEKREPEPWKCAECGFHIFRSGYGWLHSDGYRPHAARPATPSQSPGSEK